MYPLKFNPILKQTIWGGERILPFKHLSDGPQGVGESWEISGVRGSESVIANGPERGKTLTALLQQEREALVGKANYARFGDTFPLLIKFIDARQDLSIQVHPNDELAMARHNSRGKTEMWYVVAADEGARLRSGFAQQITPDEYRARVADDSITDVLKEYDIHAGDVFFLPAGRIHSIGAGAFIAEIQQTSDITYRIYDFGRRDAAGNTRELHTDLALDAIDYSVLPDYRTAYTPVLDAPVGLVSCPYFTTSLLSLTAPFVRRCDALDSFLIYICIGGSGVLTDDGGNSVNISCGETVLFPATVERIDIVPTAGELRLLETYV